MSEIADTEKAQFWDALQNRDKSFDGRFYYGVKTTGIYCRPACPSKTPAIKSIVFFESREYAFKAGFRPCKRCLPDMDITVEDGVGFGSASRLSKKAKRSLDTTLDINKNSNSGERIGFAVMKPSFGDLLVAATPSGVCSVMFGNDIDELAELLRKEFPIAEIVCDAGELSPWLSILEQYFDGYSGALNIPLDLQASVFRQRVWSELRLIPFGETRSYAQVAEAIGQPTAVRAVASACAANPVALVTPCHRVIHSDGSISGYRWGIERKQALLEYERRNIRKLSAC